MPSLIIKSKTRDSQETPLVIIVSTKVSKKATERNLIKRRIKAIMQPLIDKTNEAYMVITKPGVEKLTFKELREKIINTVTSN